MTIWQRAPRAWFSAILGGARKPMSQATQSPTTHSHCLYSLNTTQNMVHFAVFVVMMLKCCTSCRNDTINKGPSVNDVVN